METSAKPSIGGYIVAAAFLVAGGCGFITSLWNGLHHLTDDLVQVVVPGSTDIRLVRPGRYTVYHESQSVFGGKIYSTTESVAGLTCKLHAKDSGELVPLFSPGMSTTYKIGGRSGRSVLAFTIAHPGEYSFSCDYGEGQTGPETVLAIGDKVQVRVLRTIGYSFVSLFVGLIIGLALFIWTYRQRLKFERALRQGYPITG
jgi:hypothetical protein